MSLPLPDPVPCPCVLLSVLPPYPRPRIHPPNDFPLAVLDHMHLKHSHTPSTQNQKGLIQMKKVIIRRITAFIFFLFLLVPNFQCAASVNLDTYSNGSVIVYITNSGSKYHQAGCQYLYKSQIAVTLSYAYSSGYTPCSRCCPPIYYSRTDNQTYTSESPINSPPEEIPENTFEFPSYEIPSYTLPTYETYEIPDVTVTTPSTFDYSRLHDIQKSTHYFGTQINNTLSNSKNSDDDTPLEKFIPIFFTFILPPILYFLLYLYSVFKKRSMKHTAKKKWKPGDTNPVLEHFNNKDDSDSEKK